MQNRNTRSVFIGGTGSTKKVEIGGDAPVSIQTMWKEGITEVVHDSKALFSIIERIESLSSLGCDIVRFAVPDMESAEALCSIAEHSVLPVVADIHFDYKLALKCLEGNVSKIRINPGNIGCRRNVEKVVSACKEKGVAIRIGVNTGSLPRDLLDKVKEKKLTRADALVEAAAREAAVFEELSFDQYVISMKASSVKETVDCNTLFAEKYDIPLHIGVTEAGPLIAGIVKSTLAFSELLKNNIGSTVRVSLSDSPANEVIAAREILRETGKRTGGVRLVSCPRCGRNGFDVHGFTSRWQNKLMALDKNITVAVMGCVVNGPGEGKFADIGITGTGDTIIIFKHGEIVRTIRPDSTKNMTVQDKLNSLCKNADIAFEEELMSL
ncbi:MAG: (E)-4-hydroxy-3-methylbut-2-enyl-diphosphate synthase [Treponemataceae bacterium]|nr:(E)-4-hydroxy-3-methylbut-2-enyl-diphosphate synthase [Treponemataceae bacterium]